MWGRRGQCASCLSTRLSDMQCTSDLGKLGDAIARRLLRLQQLVPDSTASLGQRERLALAFVTIEVDNLIVTGLRQYAKSTLLRPKTKTGNRVSVNAEVTHPSEAAALIYQTLNPTAFARNFPRQSRIAEKDEWVSRNPRDFDRVLSVYSATNLNSFRTALSLNSPVFAEAKVFRHFFAHRCENTYSNVQVSMERIGCFKRYCPEEYLLLGRLSDGRRIVDSWLEDLDVFFDLAVQ